MRNREVQRPLFALEIWDFRTILTRNIYFVLTSFAQTILVRTFLGSSLTFVSNNFN